MTSSSLFVVPFMGNCKAGNYSAYACILLSKLENVDIGYNWKTIKTSLGVVCCCFGIATVLLILDFTQGRNSVQSCWHTTFPFVRQDHVPELLTFVSTIVLLRVLCIILMPRHQADKLVSGQCLAVGHTAIDKL